jgi:3-deoxy-manno-octulosonate cytidylyltransferase (CMP-KDO synthetase)
MADDKRSRTVVLIPARLAATRLPDKPLLPIGGVPMIVHVWRRAVEADLGPVVVACAEQVIADAVRAAGGEAVLTDPALPSGTDRIHQALGRLDPERRYELVVNVQGDLPVLEPPTLGRALYFTRATAPTGPGPVWHHIGIYAYTRAALERFATLRPSPLERRERLEQLRALENGMTIGVRLVDTVPFGVDTPADLERARAILEQQA